MQNVYAIFDKVAGESGPPFVAKNDGIATRSFIRLIADNKVDTALDYVLYKIGVYDEEKMYLTGMPCPEEVILTNMEVQNA